jgi:HEAT repeat protein
MSESSRQNDPPAGVGPGDGPAAEEKTRVATLVVQLVVIPLAVVLFCVALGGLFMWLTSERKDFDDYVRSLRASSGVRRGQQAQYLLNYIQESKRWQGIFDVTAQFSADSKEFLQRNPRAVGELTQIFTESAGQDAKTRRYLALVLGLLGDREAIPALRAGLNDADADTIKNCVWSLARFHDDESAPAIIELTRHSEASVRLMAVYALGFLQHPQARAVLVAALNDADEMVQWNAAFALANRSDGAGRDVLVRLLDKEYVDRFAETTPQNRQRYRMAAVVWLAKLDKGAALPVLEKVSAGDADLQVRNAALQEINHLRTK